MSVSSHLNRTWIRNTDTAELQVGKLESDPCTVSSLLSDEGVGEGESRKKRREKEGGAWRGEMRLSSDEDEDE